MCGIIGGITNQDITPLLIEGLKRLKYRGYDSSGWRYYNVWLLLRSSVKYK